MYVIWFKNGLPSKTCMKSGNQIQIQHQELSFHGVIDLSELRVQRHAKKKSLVLIFFEKWWQTNFAPCVGRWWLLQNQCPEVRPCMDCVANSVSCPPASSQLQPQNSWWHRCLYEMQSYYSLKNKRNYQFTFQLRHHIEIVFSMRSPSHSWKVVDSCAKAQNWRSWQIRFALSRFLEIRFRFVSRTASKKILKSTITNVEGRTKTLSIAMTTNERTSMFCFFLLLFLVTACINLFCKIKIQLHTNPRDLQK